MLILVTNDDGMASAGIKAWQIVKKNSRCGGGGTGERSAVGHAITMHKPQGQQGEIFWRRGKAGVNGTPSDCVKLGMEVLVKGKPDLVFSGINRGPNLGTDVLYSGTVSAAIEAVMMGVPSAALSLASYECEDYGTAAEFAVLLAQNMYREGLEEYTAECIFRPSQGGVKGVGYQAGNEEIRKLFSNQAGPPRTGVLLDVRRSCKRKQRQRLRHKPCGRQLYNHNSGAF